MAGEWSGTLPAERSLADEYLVSRTTLRAAVKLLEIEGILGGATSTRAGRSIQISKSRRRRKTSAGTAVVLTPSLHDSPRLLEQLAVLRELLGRSGVQIHVKEAARMMNLKKPKDSLAKLAASHPGAVWVLHKMPISVQIAAGELGLAALIFGSAFPEVKLPSYDVDFRAVARHAAGRCFSKGKRHLAVLVHRTSLAGDSLILQALTHELEIHGAPPPLVLKHDFNRARLMDALDLKIVPAANRPDALLVVNQHHLLTTLPHLLRRGLSLPRDLSLIYLSNDPAAERLSPIPDRYDLGDRLMRRLAVAIQTRLNGEVPKPQSLLPDLLPGETFS